MEKYLISIKNINILFSIIAEDESLDLNMSSVSARHSFDSPDGNEATEKKTFSNIFPQFADGDDQKLNLGLSRTNSESSLFSHISSVSEHYEKLNKLQEEEEEKQNELKKRGTLKRRAPVSTKAKEPIPTRLIDDNELSSIKRATEGATSKTLTGASGKSNLKRRNSDMSSSSSSSASSLNPNAKALTARLEQIPTTLGTNDQEIRLTRSKLKTLIEQPMPATTSTRTTLRTTANARSSNKRLEVVEETDDTGSPAKMSINNLRKHNAAMEKSNAKSKTSPTKAARSPSPTASSVISSCSQFSTISIGSSVVSSASAPKRRGRPPKNTKKTEDTNETPKAGAEKSLKSNYTDDNDQLSPTSSICSIASSTLRRSTRKTRLSLEHGSSEANESSDSTAPVKSLLARSNSDRKYNLRKKASEETSETDSVVIVESASETKTKRLTKSKNKSSSNAEPLATSSGATASCLFSIDENESSVPNDPKHSGLRSRSKETK